MLSQLGTLGNLYQTFVSKSGHIVPNSELMNVRTNERTYEHTYECMYECADEHTYKRIEKAIYGGFNVLLYLTILILCWVGLEV